MGDDEEVVGAHWHAQQQVGEGEVRNDLPVTDELVQPFVVVSVELRTRLDEFRQSRHVPSVWQIPSAPAHLPITPVG